MHHRAGLRDALPEGRKGVAAALARRDWAALTPRELAIARYAEKLTRAPAAVGAADVRALRGAGLSDREVHDAAVVVAYFAFANRVVHGLGVPLGGDEGAPGQ